MLGMAMLVPAIADAATDNPDWAVFLASAFVTLFVGGTLILTTRAKFSNLVVRQAFILTTAAWVALAAFGALPFAFSNLGLSYTDAFFEAMSGITTTGSTVITGLDTAPPGILLWRALLQWLGGIGIIVMAISILPLLQVGGMQLFRMESSDSSDKAFPRVAQISAATAIIYTILTLVCAVAMWGAGMTPFEAAAHSMTTIATGGFSTSDASIGHFDSALMDWIVIVFMILGSLPFVLYFAMIRGNPRALVRDTQVQWFLITVAVSILLVAFWLVSKNDIELLRAIRLSSFNVVSIITGTGYASADYNAWGLLPVTAFFFFMFVGGCAGSTSCGIKIFRYQILFANTRVQFRRMWQPNVVYSPRYNHKPIPESVTDAVMSFFFMFALIFGVLALALSLIGLDFVTAVSGAATAIANVGPALGPTIGPSGTFAPLPDAAKWVLSIGMLLGRLELFTVLVLFSPAFWRA
ncbi:MAG: TrkH family potassium uptake protein [Alphaproteobacteria bacterium]|nr:TrkH family potassium uptake protein [Alphaproteobacteria bacterium]MBT4082350.1 TrkH family potassium uptake protein [Alphaproteobacteria bacterium]MBT4545452.1 TrkH family potassium uptake protein [Alphaproteobacteria bacterium]MBT7746452.1 TrkH family potassium uptake protein [Alphaproteobacteria bacterium]